MAKTECHSPKAGEIYILDEVVGKDDERRDSSVELVEPLFYKKYELKRKDRAKEGESDRNSPKPHLVHTSPAKDPIEIKTNELEWDREKEISEKSCITSFGVILFVIIENEIRYQLCQRRNSISFIEFIKNNLTDNIVAEEHINLMSREERERCVESFHEKSFRKLWVDVFINNIYASKYKNCEQSFYVNMKKYMYFFKRIGGGQLENSWEFSKGKKLSREKESDLTCALREFTEETGIHSQGITIIKHAPFSVFFHGTDGKLYNSVYFLGYSAKVPNMKILITPGNLRKTQVSEEVIKIKYLPYLDCRRMLDDSKRDLLEKINNCLLFEIIPYDKTFSDYSPIQAGTNN